MISSLTLPSPSASQVGAELSIRMPLDAESVEAAQSALGLRPGHPDAGKIQAWLIYLESYTVRGGRSPIKMKGEHDPTCAGRA